MNISLPKEFNIFGPCNPLKHYMLPALPRLPEVNALIKGEKYFVLHAPRQSGKTTSIKAFVIEINEDGQYYAAYRSLEALRGIADLNKGMADIAEKINIATKDSELEGLRKAYISPGDYRRDISYLNAANIISELLKRICRSLDKESIVFFDETDCLRNGVLLAFLSQLREGYNIRNANKPFPSSLALVAMRNIKDYKASIHPDSDYMRSSSPLNIAASFAMADFTHQEIATLYAQHTEATGQIFQEEAVSRAWYWSEGQPWLSNALAKEAGERKDLGHDRPSG
jgi:hypothetical protein